MAMSAALANAECSRAGSLTTAKPRDVVQASAATIGWRAILVLSDSLSAPLILVTIGRIVVQRATIAVAIDFNVTDVAVHKADIVFGVAIRSCVTCPRNGIVPRPWA